MSDCECKIQIKNGEESKTLIILIAINGLMFLAEIVAGIISDSTALIADSLDMLADASVYGLALYAVGGSKLMKARSAILAGGTQMILGVSVLIDIVRRFIMGSEPDSVFMVLIGIIALVANIICLALIYKHRQGDVHMRASWIFSKNDVIANIGVIIGGLLVAYLGSPYPDLIIGLIITVIVIKGSIDITKDANATKREYLESS